MRAIVSVVFVSATISLLSACAPVQADKAAPQTSTATQPATQMAQSCKPGEMVYAAGSRLKQPCGSAPVQSGGTTVGW